MKSESIHIRYEQASVTHTTQFLVSAGDEELLLDCSSGLIAGENSQMLPIHTRLALPWSAAERLSDLLRQAIKQHETKSDTSVAEGTNQNRRKAQLPKLEATNA